jgi:hypothetical protein
LRDADGERIKRVFVFLSDILDAVALRLQLAGKTVKLIGADARTVAARVPRACCESNSDNEAGNRANSEAGGYTRQIELPGRAQPFAKNYYIHFLYPECVAADRIGVPQVAKSQLNRLRPLVRVIINLLSLLNLVAPLS